MGIALSIPGFFLANPGTLIWLTCILEKDTLSVIIVRYGKTRYPICEAQYKIKMQTPFVKNS